MNMLLFAIFTIGYLVGVFTALWAFVPKSELEATGESPNFYVHEGMSEWEVHQELVKPNFIATNNQEKPQKAILASTKLLQGITK